MQKTFTDALTRQLMAKIECVEASAMVYLKHTVTLKSGQLEFRSAYLHVKSRIGYALLQ